MKKWLVGLTCVGMWAAAAMGQSVVVNEYRNMTPDVVELVVVENNLNMQGMILKDYSSSGANDGGGAYTFSSDALWASVPAGTIIVLRKDATAADVTLGGSDYNLDLGLQNATYFTVGSGTFDIAGEEIIQIKASGSGQAGSTGAIHTFATATAGAQYDGAPTPKLKASTGNTGTGESVQANNATSALSDFNGTDAAGDNLTGTIGTFNNANNQTYIEGLRGPAGFGVTFDKSSGFTVESGTTEVVVATAANGTAPYTYDWDSTLGGTHWSAADDEFTILATAPTGSYTATVVATDDAALTATNTLSFTVAAVALKYGIAITPPVNGTVATTPAGEAAAGQTVVVNPTAAVGYAVGTITVVDEDMGNVPVTLPARTFTMPAKPVTVTVAFVVHIGSDLIISEVADPSGTGGGNARFVELYNAGASSINLAAGQWYLARQANGTTWGNIPLTGTVAAAGTYVVSYNLTNYTAAYPTAPLPNQTSAGIITGSGNDGYFLYSGGNQSNGVMQDAYGVIDQDGTGMPWEYTDSRAVRNAGVTAGNPTWTASEWTITDPAVYADMTPGVHPDGAAVFGVTFNKTSGFTVEQGTSDSVFATAANGVAPYTYGWTSSLEGTYFTADTNRFTILATAPLGDYSATVVATDSDGPAKIVTNSLNFSVVAPAPKYAISIVTNNPGEGTVTTAPATEAAAGAAVTVSVARAEGYRESSVVVNGGAVAVSGAGPYTFTMPAAPATVTVTFEVFAAPDAFITFETGTLPSAYAANTALLEDGKIWSTMRVVKSNSDSDKKIDTLSARLYPQTGTNAVLQQTEAYAEPITELSFSVASYGTDNMANVVLTAEVSANGTDWEVVKTLTAAAEITATLTEHVVSSIPANAVYARFVATASAVSGKRINIDNVGFNFGAASPTLSYTGATTIQLGESFALVFTLNGATASGWQYLLEGSGREDLDNGSVNTFNFTPTFAGTYYLTMTALDEAVEPIATREVVLTVESGLPPADIGVITFLPASGDFTFVLPAGYTEPVNVYGADAEVGPLGNWVFSNLTEGVHFTRDGATVTILTAPQSRQIIRIGVSSNPD